MLSHGKNIFTFYYVPAHTYLYGILLPFLAASIKMSLNFLPILFILKLLSFIFIVGFTAVSAFEILRRTKNKFLTLIGAATIFQSVIVYPRPETMGMFFAYLSLAFSQIAYKKKSLIILLSFFSLAAFYAKPYFVACVPAIMVYYLLISRKAFVTYFLSLSIFFIASFLIINNLFPLYFDGTVVNQFNVAQHNFTYMLRQTHDFIWIYPVFFLSILLGTIYWLIELITKFRSTIKKVDVFVIALISNALFLILSMGQHTGTYLTYYFHSLAIPMTIVSVSIIYALSKTFGRRTEYLTIIFAIGVLFSLFNTKSLRRMETNLSPKSANEWNRVIQIIDTHDPQKGYFSPPIALAGIEKGWPVYDNGHSEFYKAGYSNNLVLNILVPSSSKVLESTNSWQELIDNKIESKDFSIMVLTKGYHPYVKDDLLYENYYIYQTFRIDNGYGGYNPIEILLPKN